ncbi:MAG TPA: hypothetical protein VF576_13560 [Rubricoccaceae bacterium]
MISPRTLALGLTVLAVAGFTFPGVGDTATVTLSNESDFDITEVYASTCDEDDWEEDMLEDDLLEPGESAEITVEMGCWDFKAIAAGEEIEHYDIDLEDGEVAEWTISDATDDAEEEDER